MNATSRRSFDLLVFDWDGTLSDSLVFIVEAVQAAIADTGLAPRDADRIRGLVGLGLEEFARRLYPGLDEAGVAALADAYRQRWRQIPPASVPLLPGAADLLAELHALDYSIAIATGKGRRGLDEALRHSGVGQYIHASRCADETASKPHPQMLLELMQLFDAMPARTLMVGDSEHDMMMARNAGTAAAALSVGDRDPAPLLESGPLACFTGLVELRRWLSTQDGRITSR
ncbi:MAG TPA: HAD-IA family hydrolase [Gammaproteobacteria bacterium]